MIQNLQKKRMKFVNIINSDDPEEDKDLSYTKDRSIQFDIDCKLNKHYETDEKCKNY